MQSQQKNNELAAGLAIIGFIGLIFIALIGFLVAVLSVVCIFAWNKPVRFMGETITPEEARGFIKWGAIGGFVGLLAASNAAGDARMYLPLVGYVIGALGFALHHHLQTEADKNAQPEILPPTSTPPTQHPSEPQRPFTFASWDDEEMR